MTTVYQQKELESARKEANAVKATMDAAKAAYERSRSRKDRGAWLAACESYEFWTNRSAFLSHVKADQ